MNIILDFYKELSTLDLIIFWGIIIVLVLLLIFSIIMLNKNKKLKKLIDEQNKSQEEFNKELPIKKENIINNSYDLNIQNSKEKEENETFITLPESPVLNKEDTKNIDNNSNIIEVEKKFIAEEHVMEYSQDLFNVPNIKKASQTNDIKSAENIKEKNNFEMPSGPYQRNVLREMALSQTSPIGLTPPKKKEETNDEIVKDLEESLNVDLEEKNHQLEEKKTIAKEEIKIPNEQPINKYNNITKSNTNDTIKKELNSIKEQSIRKTEINLSHSKEVENKSELTSIEKTQQKEPKEVSYNNEKNQEVNKRYKVHEIDPRVKELLNSINIENETKNSNNSSEKYLEEVSKKLAEAEITDEIERTDYEIEQEENAIISYKELMEKKDSIQTIDEEDAIISIEELMNRKNPKTEEEIQIDRKLYNLNDSEENDDFIKELKQFRNDL